MAHDREERFLFSPLQSDFASKLLGPESAGELKTLIVIDYDSQGRQSKLTQSDAVLRIASHLGGIWRLAEVFRIVPKPVRDAAYAFVAAHRYQWFGKKDTCRMPTPAERKRFVLA
jgi:predicted DCC family thiol-disulfide oxidoreductase YuxK